VVVVQVLVVLMPARPDGGSKNLGREGRDE